MKKTEGGVIRWRIYFIFFLFFIAGCVIIWRLYCLQIKRGEHYEAWALGQQVSYEDVASERGEIFLDQGKFPLAQTKTKYLLFVTPKSISASLLEPYAQILSDLLNEDKEGLISMMQEGRIIKREISEEIKSKIKKERLEGGRLEDVYTRFYPQDDFASHVIGFVNESHKGQYGIEHYYNDVLEGEEFLKEKERSLFSFLDFKDGASDEDAISKGNDIWLTIDYNIQYFAEKLMKQAKDDWDIDSGQIIVMEPSTGKLLAIVEYPNFDPNNYGKENDLGIFLNTTTQKLFEPGSVFKAITMAAGLEEELVTPETTYEDEGIIEVGGPPIYNFEKRVWGEQSMIDVLEESINTGAVFVQQELGDELFFKYVKRFGFTEKTGIDLQGEISSNNKGLEKGYPRDFATASFGQGILMTPIQLVASFSAVANKGRLMKPYIVERVVKPTGEYAETEPKEQARAISEKTAAKLTAMLVSVVKNGSARSTKIPGYHIAGKTGTAQVPNPAGGYYEHNTIHSFVGYFPALSPQAVILIKLDNPKGIGSAGYSTVPIFKELAQYIIDLKQIPPTQEVQGQASKKAVEPEPVPEPEPEPIPEPETDQNIDN